MIRHLGLQRQHLNLAVVALCVTAILELPYLRWSIYEPLRQALDQSNAEFGLSMSAYGLISLLAYIPGGLLADRVDNRLLFAIGSIATGLLGLWFMNFPGVNQVLWVHALWAISINLTVWPSMLKLVSVMAGQHHPARVFSLFELFKSIALILVSLLIVISMRCFEQTQQAVSFIIGSLSWVAIVLGAISFSLIKPETTIEQPRRYPLQDLKFALSSDKIWLCSGTIFCVYWAHSSLMYSNAYLENWFTLSASMVAAFAVLRKNVLRLVIAYAVARYTNNNDYTATSFILTTLKLTAFVSLLLLLSMWFVPNNLIVFIIATLAVALFVTVIRTIYFSIIQESQIPKPLLGIAIGVCSTIAFSSDVIQPLIFGYLLDAYQVEGYRYIAAISLIVLLLGCVLCGKLVAKNHENQL